MSDEISDCQQLGSVPVCVVFSTGLQILWNNILYFSMGQSGVFLDYESYSLITAESLLSLREKVLPLHWRLVCVCMWIHTQCSFISDVFKDLLVLIFTWTIEFGAEEIDELSVLTEISGEVQIDWSVLRSQSGHFACWHDLEVISRSHCPCLASQKL